MTFEDYRVAEKAGAVRRFETLADMAAAFEIPAAALAETVEQTRRCAGGEALDPFGRDLTGQAPLQAPFYAERKRVVSGKSVSVRVDHGGLRNVIKTTISNNNKIQETL